LQSITDIVDMAFHLHYSLLSICLSLTYVWIAYTLSKSINLKGQLIKKSIGASNDYSELSLRLGL